MKKLLLIIFCLFISTNVLAKLVTKKHVRANTENYYTINIEYPYLIDLEITPSTVGFNRTIHHFNVKQIANFKHELAPNQSLINQSAERNTPLNVNSNALFIRYKLIYQSKHLISVRFNISAYFYGAAHPTPTMATINYNLISGKVLTLANMFKPNSDYLPILAKYSRQALVKKLILHGPKHPHMAKEKRLTLKNPDYAMIIHGTRPVAQNYRYWNISKQGLSITFPTYQVAAYVFGPQTVLIPTKLILHLLKKPLPELSNSSSKVSAPQVTH